MFSRLLVNLKCLMQYALKIYLNTMALGRQRSDLSYTCVAWARQTQGQSLLLVGRRKTQNSMFKSNCVNLCKVHSRRTHFTSNDRVYSTSLNSGVSSSWNRNMFSTPSWNSGECSISPWNSWNRAFAKIKSTKFSVVSHCGFIQRRAAHRSSLFNSDQEGNTSNFQFDHGLDNQLADLEQLHTNLKSRGSSIDPYRLNDDYQRLCHMRENRLRLESRREAIAQQIAAIVKHQKHTKPPSKEASRKLKELKEEGKLARESLKTLMTDYWNVEERVMLTALAIPNYTLPSVTDRQEVLEEHFTDQKPQTMVDHYNVLRRSQCVRLSNVGTKAYYLRGRLAVLEQELIDWFTSQLTLTGFSPMLAPEIFKTPVAEGSGMNVLDPASLYRLQHKQGTSSVSDWDQEHLFLIGCSHLSFAAYYARMLIQTDSLPLKRFTVGRSYTPRNDKTDSLPGLFGCLQTIKVCMTGLSGSQEHCIEMMEDMKSTLTTIYTQFELPFRIVSVPLESLRPWEQNRIEAQVWIPSMRDYLQVGMVSVHGDYNSRRLMIRCAKHKNAVTSPVYMVYGEVADITKVLALLLEYNRTEQAWIANSTKDGKD